MEEECLEVASALTEALCDRRQELGISQRDLAERTGFSRSSIQAWESGATQPGFLSLLMWVSSLRCILDMELIYEEEEA